MINAAKRAFSTRPRAVHIVGSHGVSRRIAGKAPLSTRAGYDSDYWKSASKIICIGRNYADHIAELGNLPPSKPFFFLKPISSVLPPIPDGKTAELDQYANKIRIPKGVNCHYEVELALVMKGFTKAPKNPEEYFDLIKGYAIAIDLTARNLQEEAKKAGLPWTMAKGYDTFCPISQFIPKTVIPDPHDVRLQLSVNGEIRQDDNTNLMIFKIPDIIKAISEVMSIDTGDIILTGTPKGVGRIVAGDEIVAKAFVGDSLISSSSWKVADRVDEQGNPY